MKKFSNISGVKVGEAPKVVEQKDEVNEFKHSIMQLMDNFLTIQSYGSARQEIMMTTKIVGKELFVEALTDLLSQKTNERVVESLESLKSTVRDWKAIEEKIESIKTEKVNIKAENKINQIISKYGDDEGSLELYMEQYTSKLNTQEANEKYLIVEAMSKKSNNKLLRIISNSLSKKITK